MKLWKRKTRQLFALIMAAVLFAGSTDYAALFVSAEKAAEHLDTNLTDAENPDNDLMLLQQENSDDATLGDEKSTETDISGENEDAPKAEDSTDRTPETEDAAGQTTDDGEPQTNLSENSAFDTDKNDGELTTSETDDSDGEAVLPETDGSDAETAPAEADNNGAEPAVPEADSNDAETDNNDMEAASDDDTSQYPANTDLLQSDMETPESEDGVVTEFTEEFIDLGDTYTSAPGGISLFSLNDGKVDLKNGSYVNWIDRVDLPDYAVDFYNTLVEASDNDWIDDFLIEDRYFSSDAKTTLGAGIYGILVGTFIRYSEFSDNDPEYLYIQKCIRTAYDAFDRDHPEVFWLTGETRLYITCSCVTSGSTTTYTYKFYFLLKDMDFGRKDTSFDIRSQIYYNQNDIKSFIRELEENISTILEDSIPSDGDREAQIRALNDWLTKHNQYNTNLTDAEHYYPDSWECVSALEGRAGESGPVCEGYSRAFKVLCDELNIPCVLVDGNARSTPTKNPGAHMWNYVELNGNWYAVDVTWNDPVVPWATDGVSNRETDKWLLLCSDSLVEDNWTFIDSHPVENRVSVNGVEFINGPQLVTTADKNKKDISDAVVTLASAGYIYNGKPHEPKVTVTLNGQALTKGTDYTVSYKNNINAGTASVTITAKGNNYKGKKTTTFQIGKAANAITASNFTKTASTAAQSFSIGAKRNGSGKITYSSNNKSVAVDSNGKVTIAKNFAGKATITIKVAASGSYKAATKTITVTVNQTAGKITASNFKKTTSAKAQSFSLGVKRSGSGKITYSSNNKSVTVNTSGRVTIAKNFVGKATITIKVAASGIYKAATKAITVTVNPANTSISSVKNSASKKMTVAWKKSTAVTGYQIQYSTDKSFKTGVKTVTVSKNSTVSTTVSSLTKGKTYYVRIRTYKTVSGTKYYSGWSGSKTVKITK